MNSDKYKNIDKALDSIFGIFADDYKEEIFNAAEKDFNTLSKVENNLCSENIVSIFNSVFSKKSRVISKKVSNKYNEILRYYDVDEIKSAMINAKNDSFHKENGYKYCTLEYFSRLEQIDKWINVKEVKENTNFTTPKFYTKE